MTANLQTDSIDSWHELREPDDAVDYWIMPIILMFVGLFLGPFSTLLSTAIVARFRIDGRTALFLIGLAGTTICTVQAVTVIWGSIWEAATTYSIRGAINVVFGVACYAIARRVAAEGGFFVSRRSLLVTLIVGGLIVLVYFLIPPRVLLALGR